MTDKGWTGSTLGAGEGVMVYTAPSDLPAGTVIRYTDCLVQSSANGWTRNGLFDPATSGDTLLVYQGSDASPSFIYGFGFGTASWISSGTISSATSYIPAALSGSTAYITGKSVRARDYQYTTAGNYGIYSSVFLDNIRNMTYWQSSGTNAVAGTMYGPTTVPFDSTRPTFVGATRFNPSQASTNASTLQFRVTTSEPVQDLSSSAFTVAGTGTLTYTSVTTTKVDSSTYLVTVTGVSGTGTIKVSGFTDAQLLDLRRNPALDTSITSELYTIDHDPPSITITAPTKLSNGTITDTTIRVTDNTGINASDVVVAPTGSTAGTSGLSCAQTSATQVDCIISVTSSGDVNIQATDTLGTATTKLETNYIVDVTAPVFSSVTVDVTTHGVNQPVLSFSATDNIAVSHYEVIYTADNSGPGVDSSSTTINPATSPVTLSLDPDEAVHTVTVRVYDTAGNFTDHVIKFPPIVNFNAPTTLSNTPITNSTVTITSPLDNDLTNITLSPGTTGATLGACTGDGGDVSAPYASPVTCVINAVNATGTVTVNATDSVTGAVGQNSQSYIIDTTPPVITISAPTKLHNAAITDTTVNVSDDIAILASDIILGAGTTATATNFYCTQVNATQVSCTVKLDTSGNLEVSAMDKAGNTAAKSELGYIIDTDAPVVVIDTLSTITALNQSAYPVSGACTTADGNVTVTINGTTLSVPCADSIWSLTIDLTGVADGPNAITVSASQTDAAHNTGIAPVRTAAKDTLAPTVTVTSQTTNSSSPRITGTVNDATASITVTINGKTYTAVNNGDGTWVLDAGAISPGLVAGTYDIVVTANDAADNASTDATGAELTIVPYPSSLASTGQSIWQYMLTATTMILAVAIVKFVRFPFANSRK
ncbi:MAG: hypothetical protein KA604_00610 [Candidatus Saccharimonas sp.]|nr:hypothetical protein [Candidatus Saccharimonas sp.]